MDDRNLLQLLGQVSGVEASQIFREHIRGFVRTMICEVMASQVDELCGPSTSLPAVSCFEPQRLLCAVGEKSIFEG